MTSQPGDVPEERDERPVAADDERMDATPVTAARPGPALEPQPEPGIQRDRDAEQDPEAQLEPDAEQGAEAPLQPAADQEPEPELFDRVEQDDVEVKARLVPRYGRFMAIGLVLGAGGGYLWSRLGSSGPWLGSGQVVDTSAVVPFLVAVGALVGLVVGAVLAIVLDRIVGRRSRTITAERTRHRLE